MSFLASANLWIAGHQALVVAFGLPMLIAVATAIVTYSNNRAILKSQEKDRELQRHLRAFDEKIRKIELLRSKVVQLQVSETIMKAYLRHPRAFGEDVEPLKSRIEGALEQQLPAILEIMLLVDGSDPEAAAMNEVEVFEFADYLLDGFESSSESRSKDAFENYFSIVGRIIQRMEREANAVLVS